MIYVKPISNGKSRVCLIIFYSMMNIWEEYVLKMNNFDFILILA